MSVSRDDGFSLVEALTAMLLTVIVLGAAIGLANPHTLTARVQPDVVDSRQRLRAAADVLYEALYTAGAGVDAGVFGGPLGRFFPPILPRLIGRSRVDPADVARADAVTILHVPAGAAQSVLAAPFAMPTARLTLLPGCPALRPACGLRIGDGVVLFDDLGHFEVFTVSATTGLDASLQQRGVQTPWSYAAGSQAAEAELRSFYFDATQNQLRYTDGDGTDQPAVDGLSLVTFEYFGQPLPPRLPRSPAGVANCLYDAAGRPDPALTTLPAGSDGLASLPAAILTDGPWCGTGDTRFDADLLRIRRVRVRVTAVANTAHGQPTAAVVFDVAPRNLTDQP